MAGGFGDLAAEYCSYEAARVVIVPVPYDGTSTWVKGADKGADAIIEASGHMELYDIETDSEVYKKGIFTDGAVAVGGGPDEMVAAVRERVAEHVGRGKFVVVVGGEHSVSIGAIEAQAQTNAGMSALQLDAHADMRQEYERSRYSHACVMARAREFCPVVQVGIRSMDAGEKEFMEAQNVFLAEQIRSDADWMGRVVERLGEKVYVTLDLDVFDPAVMPATGTPEPGGLSWYDVIGLMKMVMARRDVVGFDVVELCPQKHNKGPEFLAAKLIYKMLSYKMAGR